MTVSTSKDNVIVSKSFDFALNIIDLYDELKKINHFEIAKQVIRSGTSVGANIREAQRAVSKADFIHKLSISLKEADETKFWFEIIDAKILRIDTKLKNEVEELIKILVSIINSTKKNHIKIK